MRYGRVHPACSLVLVLVLVSPGLATGEKLTIDWIFSDEGKTVASVPSRAWLDTGIAMFYDTYPPKRERTLESFDPVTGEREVVVDAAKALSSLNTLLEPEKTIEEIGWPDSFDTTGRWAAYEHDNDVVLLDLRSSEFVPVAVTDADEKSARFSPDGKKLAFVRDNDLWIWDVEERTEKRLTTDGSDTLLNGTVSWVYWEEVFGRNDTGYWWAPDSRSLAYLQSDESMVGVMNYLDVKPNVPRLIQQRYPKAGEANPRVRAGVIGADGGKTTWIDLGVYPYEYLVRVNWLPDSKRLAVQTLDRPQTALDLFLADAATGKVEHILRETDDGWVNIHDDLYFLKHSDRFLWASERDGYSHLYLYENDGTLVGQVTRGEWALRASASVFWLRQTVAHIDEKNDWVYFTALAKSSIEKHLYRVHMDGSGMERLTDEDGTHRILFRRDGAFYFDSWSAIDQLPSLTLRRPEHDQAVVISPRRPERLERFDLLPRELFTIATNDGFAMPAMMLKPRDFDPSKRYPVVIFVYGGPSAPTVSHAWRGRSRGLFEQLLANKGFIVFSVDNRSATAISKKLENRIAREGYGSTELADLLDAVKWLKSQSYVDPDRVGIWGWSGGGSFTLLAMTRSDEFRAGIAVAAVSDWHYYDTKWTEAFMKTPQANPEGYEMTSHAERAKNLSGRLLLVHGTYDDNVHPQNAWRFTNELIDARIVFDMMIYPMRKHGITDNPAQKHLYTTMLEFWNRNLR
jgi:dipeptidyl-peptidase-4